MRTFVLVAFRFWPPLPTEKPSRVQADALDVEDFRDVVGLVDHAMSLRSSLLVIRGNGRSERRVIVEDDPGVAVLRRAISDVAEHQGG